jgi:guanine deaminase
MEQKSIEARILKGDICYSTDKNTLKTYADSYLILENGLVKGVFHEVPEQYHDAWMEDI